MQSVKIGKLLRQLAVLISAFSADLEPEADPWQLDFAGPADGACHQAGGGAGLLYLQPDQHRQPHGAVHCVRMASFMGLLNSYREICKDREIIFREASVGVSLLATVLSKAITLFLVEAVQAGILTAGFVEIIHIPQNHLLLDTNVEIFITIFLLMAASSAMGLLVSASLKAAKPRCCWCWCSSSGRWCSAALCSV